MVVVAAAFIISIGLASLVARRVRVSPRWMAVAVAMFVLPAALTFVALHHPTDEEVGFAYARGAISYDAFHAGVERADRAYDWTAVVGLAGTLLCLGFATLFERVRAFDARARTASTDHAAPPPSS
jgi:hypothetical protein